MFTVVCVCVCVITAAARRDGEGGLGVRLAVRLEVPPEAEEDGQLQAAQVEVSHGAAGEDGAGGHLCPGVFSGERERAHRYTMWPKVCGRLSISKQIHRRLSASVTTSA